MAGGELVPLPEQDRGGWDRALIAEGHALVRECLDRARRTGRPPGRYQLLAAVNAVHTDAPIVGRHRLAPDRGALRPARRRRPGAGGRPEPGRRGGRARRARRSAWRVVDRLALTGYHAWHATRADLLRRLGRSAEARAAYDAAIAATDNPAERAFLTRRRGQLAG